MNFGGMFEFIVKACLIVLAVTVVLVGVVWVATMWLTPIWAGVGGAAAVYLVALPFSRHGLTRSGIRLWTMPAGAIAAFVGSYVYHQDLTVSGAVYGCLSTMGLAAVLLPVAFLLGCHFAPKNKP